MQKTYKFKKGDRPVLDQVYDLLGIIPNDAIHQDDIGEPNSDINPDNDSGESILFLKNVTIKIDIKVT